MKISKTDAFNPQFSRTQWALTNIVQRSFHKYPGVFSLHIFTLLLLSLLFFSSDDGSGDGGAQTDFCLTTNLVLSQIEIKYPVVFALFLTLPAFVRCSFYYYWQVSALGYDYGFGCALLVAITSQLM